MGDARMIIDKDTDAIVFDYIYVKVRLEKSKS